MTPRVRMFAGPNGSGKSILKSVLSTELLGIYLNADDIEKEVKNVRKLDLKRFGVDTTEAEVLPFFTNSDFLQNCGLGEAAKQLAFSDDCLDCSKVEFNSYFASVLVDFLRQKLLQTKTTFTFETVMSHASKIEILRAAQNLGYRTYLYYVATDDPAINISRVQNRVKLNGHDVPTEAIVKRYHRSLNLLIDAIHWTNRAYIFDNSTDNSEKKHTWLAEVTEGITLEIKADRIPAWFKRAVLDKLS